MARAGIGRGFMGHIAIIAVLACLPSADAATMKVANFAEVMAAVEKANPGDVIEVQPGVYRPTDARNSIRRPGQPGQPITMRGVVRDGQRPAFDAEGRDIDRGIFYIWETAHDWVFENLEFRDAHGGDSHSHNAAAAYIKAANITFRDCYSHDNDNGWFSTHTADNTLLEFCETAYNGADDGYTHNHYMSSPSITLRGCYVHDSRGGQNYKDRSQHTRLEYNWFQNPGNYDIDWASNGEGNALMIGNVIVRLNDSGNRKIINLGDSSGVRTGTITLINNTIIALDDRYRVFERAASSTARLVLYNNVIFGSRTVFSKAGWDQFPTTGSNNWFPQSAREVVTSNAPGLQGSIFGAEPGFADFAAGDYRLKADSPCRDAGAAEPKWLDAANRELAIKPTLEYVKQRALTARAADAALDVGAYEHR
jgi:hypothetical protein